jgi:hypothetical protein
LVSGKIANGGKRLEAENIRIIMKRCMEDGNGLVNITMDFHNTLKDIVNSRSLIFRNGQK